MSGEDLTLLRRWMTRTVSDLAPFGGAGACSGDVERCRRRAGEVKRVY
jgi:hypothetical protein